MKAKANLFCTLWFLWNGFLTTHAQWTATFNITAVRMTMATYERTHVVLSGLPQDVVGNINNRSYVRLETEDAQVARVDYQNDIEFVPSLNAGSWEAYFDINGVFIGSTRIFVEIGLERSQSSVDVTVLRLERLVDTLFAVSVIILLGILFINFGAAIDMTVIKGIFVKPVGASIGTVGTLIIMPLLSYGLGVWLFPDAPEMAVGLFLVGIAPSAGANFHAFDGWKHKPSILMTTISTLVVFGTIPMWLFTLGATIFDRASLSVPYLRITLAALSLLVPLGIGWLIKRCLPKVGKFLVRILKPLSGFFIIFVIVFATSINLYMVQLVTWQVGVATMLLPWLGFIIGWIISLIFRQQTPDTIAIVLESGSKNTGLVMFLITFALEQPAADIAMIIPIAISILTPIPLIIYGIIRKILKCQKIRKLKKMEKDSPSIDPEQTATATERL